MADLSQDQSLKPNPTINPPGDSQSSQNQGVPTPPTAPSEQSSSTPPTTDSSFPPIKEEEKFATPKQEEIKKELSELGISPKSSFKKTRVVLASLGVLFLIASLPAAVYLVRQRQEIRKEAANTGWTGTSPHCTGNCDVTIGPGNFGFETGGIGTPDVQNPNTEKSVSIKIPSGTTVHEAYIFWSGECDPGKNDTSIVVNGVNTTAHKM